MSQITLEISSAQYAQLRSHLIREESRLEQAAFGYARPAETAGQFFVIDLREVPPEGFIYQTDIGFELTDEMRGVAIKRAHDLDASLVEFHSHTYDHRAAFSPSDRFGFTEFVPHVWWRLKEKAYFSLVMARDSLDALAWITGPENPERLTALVVAGEVIRPTMRTPLPFDLYLYD